MDGLQLTLTTEGITFVKGAPIWINWKLTNTGEESLLVTSHYEAGRDRHFDPLTLTVDDGNGPVAVKFVRPRAATRKVNCLIDPKNTLNHRINLNDWLDSPLPEGSYTLGATYHVREQQSLESNWCVVDAQGECTHAMNPPGSKPGKSLWHGHIRSNAVHLEIQGA